MFRAIIFIVIIGLATPFIKGQTETIGTKDVKKVISILPQYTFISGFRADLDIRLKNSQNWIVLAPQIYSSKNDDLWDFDFKEWFGLGLQVSHRYYTVERSIPDGLYGQYGITYNYTQLNYEGEEWINTTFNGSNALTTETTTLKDHIHKIGFDVIIGYQVMLQDWLTVDCYLGMGYRNGIVQKNNAIERDISRGILNPAFTGFLPIGGCRLGIAF